MNGFALYGVIAVIQYAIDDAYGHRALPTFYVLGGGDNDAEANARTIIGVKPGDPFRNTYGRNVIVTKVNVSVNRALPDVEA